MCIVMWCYVVLCDVQPSLEAHTLSTDVFTWPCLELLSIIAQQMDPAMSQLPQCHVYCEDFLQSHSPSTSNPTVVHKTSYSHAPAQELDTMKTFKMWNETTPLSPPLSTLSHSPLNIMQNSALTSGSVMSDSLLDSLPLPVLLCL